MYNYNTISLYFLQDPEKSSFYQKTGEGEEWKQSKTFIWQRF